MRTQFSFGWLYGVARLTMSAEITSPTNPGSWIGTGLFLLAAVLLGVLAYFLISRFINAMRKLEANVKEHEKLVSLQQAVFDAAADGILAVDHTGKITTFNRKFTEMWNIPETLITSREDAQIVAFVLQQLENPAEFLARIKALYAHPQDEGDDLIKLKDGRIFERYTQPQRLGDDIVGRVWVFRDVTAQKSTEEALARERNLLRAVVDTLPHIVFAKDSAGRKILANAGDQTAMGVKSEAEALGKTDFEIYPYEKAARFAAEDRAVLEEGVVFESESTYVDTSGQRHWLSGSKRPFRNEAGEIIGLVGVFHDITPLRQAEIEREALIADLEAKNAELERFTYTVSHDLKSPLITIRGFLGFLEQDALNGRIDQARHDIELISDAANKMQQLLDELLELSRIGRLRNPPQAVSLSELAREAAELVAGQLMARGVEVEIAPDMPTVVGDRPRLREVFENLLGNAAKFMGTQPHPRVEIGVRYDKDEPQPVIYVRDNGIGIEPQYHEKIFGLFEKLDATSEGTGIGLAIVKRIIEVHKGRIWVESEGHGRGSAFCFTLPQS
ncbi:MAG TPA: ATP-binding protein [Anaerolineae bacterium]|nr:ATP-binding protein [Anaerolineae bacterium]HQK13789.1 ATP-binding protein [Anaerolineae bacterium]